jgi:tRNA modification GTPase
MQDDTIVAIATPLVPEQGSVAIVRLSGSEAQGIAQALFVTSRPIAWESHRIYYGHIHAHGRVVDEILLLWMQAPRSFTREDVVELHCHGGLVVVQQVLALCLQQGARLAQPGEFTLRAFLHGRLDLTQAEAIGELITSRSPQAAQIAMAGLTGKLAQPIRHLQSQLTEVLAEVEARIDFEEDLPPFDAVAIERMLTSVEQELDRLIQTADQGELLRSGLRVALVGRPNVGKSSILNYWSQTERAIVTDLPGTTRDLLDMELNVRGMPVRIVDTAGIRLTQETVEKIGIERSRQAMQQADLVLLVIEAHRGWLPEDQAIYDEIHMPCLILVNKVDLAVPPQLPLPCPQIAFSAHAQRGITELEDQLWQMVGQGMTGANLDLAVNQRQKAALLLAQTSLKHLRQTQAAHLPLDFWSIDLRDALGALMEITGEGVSEAILDRIFSKFCIGK